MWDDRKDSYPGQWNRNDPPLYTKGFEFLGESSRRKKRKGDRNKKRCKKKKCSRKKKRTRKEKGNKKKKKKGNECGGCREGYKRADGYSDRFDLFSSFCCDPKKCECYFKEQQYCSNS